MGRPGISCTAKRVTLQEPRATSSLISTGFLALSAKEARKGCRKQDRRPGAATIVPTTVAGMPSFSMAIPVEKAKEIIALNKKGQKPEKLEDFAITTEQHTNNNEGFISDDDLKKMSD